MKLKTFTSIIFCFFVFLSACRDSHEHLNSINPPKTGGLITKSGENYAVVVRYRDGTVKRTTAELIKKIDPKIRSSTDATYTFNIKGCGHLVFIQPPAFHAILMADDADAAHQEPKCIISGGVENKWKINA